MWSLYLIFMLMAASRLMFLPVNALQNHFQVVRPRANFPVTFLTPPNDPLKAQHLYQMKEAWRDAMQMSALVHLTFSDCEDAFEHYFEPQNAKFVKGVFGAIARAKNPLNIDPKTDDDRLKIMTSGIQWSEKFTELIMYGPGDHPDVSKEERYCEKALDLEGKADEFMYIWQFRDDEHPNRAIVNVCELAFRFPGNTGIEVEGVLSRAKGPGRSRLGTFDNGYMTSMGSLLLHELMHWKYLLKGVDDYVDVTKGDEEGIISDYDRDDRPEDDLKYEEQPLDGNGPYNCFELALNKHNDAVMNADNYRWYATTKWWSYRCQKNFDRGRDDDGKTGDKVRWQLPEGEQELPPQQPAQPPQPQQSAA